MQRWHGFHVFDKIQAKVSIGFGQGSFGKGDQYWVDGFNGSSTASGKSPDEPLDTIEGALALCSGDNDDYIWVMQGYQEGEAINVNKSLVHIIAYGSPFATFLALNVATDIHVMEIESVGNHAEIAGFAFGGGSTKAGIYLRDSYSVWIHHNVFGHEYPGSATPKYGIEANTAPTGVVHSVFEDNVFYGTDGAASFGKIDANGMLMYGVKGCVIRRNIFMGIPGINLQITDSVKVIIVDNQFALDGDTTGRAITLAGSSAGCWIHGNYAGFGKTVMSNVPWADAGSDNHWGLNPVQKIPDAGLVPA